MKVPGGNGSRAPLILNSDTVGVNGQHHALAILCLGQYLVVPIKQETFWTEMVFSFERKKFLASARNQTMIALLSCL